MAAFSLSCSLNSFFGFSPLRRAFFFFFLDSSSDELLLLLLESESVLAPDESVIAM